jgi:hypothetical protein
LEFVVKMSVDRGYCRDETLKLLRWDWIYVSGGIEVVAVVTKLERSSLLLLCFCA